MTAIPYGEWLPDLPDHLNPGALSAKNCIAGVASYRGFKGLSAFTNALDNACLGAFSLKSKAGTIFNFASDVAKLYELTDVTWDNVSKAGGYAAIRWEFARFGDRVIAVDIADQAQFFDLGSSTLFADLPEDTGNAPNARHVGVIRDFLVFGNVDDGVARPNRVTWSGFNNSQQWAPSAATQAGSQDLKAEGGDVMRIVGGDVGIIFQESAITRMAYVGPPVIFRFDDLERSRGTVASDSVAWNGSQVFYYAEDGFYMMDMRTGGPSVPIGANRVDQFFKDNAATDEIVNMVSVINRPENLVMWSFKSSGSSPINDRMLMYNWESDRWSNAEVDVQQLVESHTEGLTLDELDTPLPAGIDIDSISVDSTAFQGGVPRLVAFDNLNKAATFSGANLDIELDTKEFSLEGSFSWIDEVRPIVEANGTISLTALTRDRLIDNPVAGMAQPINNVGVCELRSLARYLRWRLTGTSEVNHAVGVEFNPVRKGRQ